jgi:Carboxypeptidase regulatory-like domain/TonB dependent receptor
MNRVLSALALCFVFCFSLNGQVAITGRITGLVTDPTGAAMPNGTVTLKSSALMADRSTKTQPDGSYLFDLLPPGDYELTASAPGFKTAQHTGIVISAGFTATVNAKLSVGAVQETVTVQGQGGVDVQSVEASTTFDQSLLQEIPSGRDPWSTVAQMPGATSSTVDVGGNQSYQQSTMQVHGSTPGEQIFSFNGLDLNWPGANGGYTQFYTNHDSFEEFQVVADNAPASVSISGIYMNMVTKSGSNQLHGSAAAYFASAGMEAGVNSPTFSGSPVAAASPINHDRDTSVGLGGPIITDKWWIYGSYRRYDLRESVLAVPTINGSPTADVNHQTNTDLRSDWQLGKKNKVSLIWLYNEQNRFFRRDTGYQFVSQDASWRQIEPAYVLEGLWTSQLSNNLLLDVRVGYNKEVFPLGYQPGVSATAFTRQDVTLSTESGAAPFSFVNPSWVYKNSAAVSWYKATRAGAHNLKVGFEWGDSLNPYVYSINQGINAQYSNGQPLDVIAFDTPFTEKDYLHDTSFYVQDAWTLKQRLTLNLGLRFDRLVSFYPKQSTSSNLTFPQLFPPTTFSASGNLIDWNNVSPRVGLAFDITGKGTAVVRFSFGRYYKMEGTQLLEAVNPVGFAGKTFSWTDTNGDGIPQTSEWLNAANLIGQFGGTTTHIDPNISRPYSNEYSVSFEKQLWRDLSVTAAYYYRSKKDLIGLLNQAAPRSAYTAITNLNGTPIKDGVTGQPLTLYSLAAADVGQSNILMTNIATLNDNSYNGVEFTGVKRMSHRWQLLTGFTVQRQKGTFSLGGSDDALSDDFNNPNFDINRKNNYLNMDSTYVFKAASTYDLPWFGASVNFQHYTGFPIQPTQVFSGPELNQGFVSVILQPAGILRYPNVNLLNLRLSHEFSFHDRYKVEPLIDFFNVTNAQTVVSENTVFGSSYQRPSNTVNPFLARVGLRVNF